MSQLLSPPSVADRPDSRLSLALSDTTYHSFHDAADHEARPTHKPVVHTTPAPPKHHKIPSPGEMRRQDSGYESLDRRDSSTSSTRRASTISLTSSSTKQRRRARPSAPRSSKSSTGPVSHLPRHARPSISPTRSHHHRPREPVPTYFQFPHFTASEPAFETSELPKPGYVTAYPVRSHESGQDRPPPPQTTHYWTSDRTRRLEYAAIDAASRGVRGWVMRHVVPDCFVPKSKRRVGFEDDTGSVVRYRLDLEEESPEGEKPGRGRRWWFGRVREG
ncbi:hypothetical protein QBC39DRAFT_246972 [Podospora conica]|nr:hypothetical protein QBC39DRAFT_246972 [Schizothecium conicum]